MSVVVGPLRRDASGRWRRGAAEQRTLPDGERPTGSRFLDTERLEEPHQHPVAQLLELARRLPARLRVGLLGDLLHELVRQLGDVGQMRPRPLERRPELVEEMAHSLLTARDAIREVRPHERPAQAGAVADRVVHLLDRGDAVVDEPERLAPQRLEQPVGDEAVDLAADDERLHPDGAEHFGRPLDRLRRSPLTRTELDEREEVDRVERVRDAEPLGALHPCLQLARPQPRGGRADERVRRGHAIGLREQRALELDALGGRLLD